MSRVLISMPKEFLNGIDKVAKSEKRTRSELIREALKTYIKRANVPNLEKANKNAKILEDILS